jgi:hypothetical protein
MNIDQKLWKAILRLMKKLNDDDQSDCLYQPTEAARDAVNKLMPTKPKGVTK